MQKQVKMVEDRLTRLSKQHDLKRAAANTDMEKIKLERQCIEDEQVQAQVRWY